MKTFLAVAVAALAVLGAHADDSCERMCTDEYAPVCASNGRTYSNPCAAEVAACRLGLTLTTAAGECPPAACTDACVATYAPVCGTDGITYTNECELTRLACNSFAPISVLHQGECIQADCPEMCTEEYQPLCTSGGLTFENLCKLFSARCRAKGFAAGALDVAHIGRCQREDCPDACAKIHEPVCGSDGVTYGNECTLRHRNCRRGEAVLALRAGSCDVPTDCATATCPANTQCVPMTRECFAEPCPQFECVPIDNGDSCDAMCPMVYAPVCGNDLATYSNECELEAASCRARTSGLAEITVLHAGECVDADDVGSGGDDDVTPVWQEPAFIGSVVLAAVLLFFGGLIIFITIHRRRKAQAGMIRLVNVDEPATPTTTSGMIATGSTSLRDAK